MTEKDSSLLGLELYKPDQCLTGADGSKLNVLGIAKVAIKSTYRSIDTSVYVLKGSRKNLLGIQELKKLNLLAVINSMCISEFDPLKKFSKVFEGLGTMPGTFTVELEKQVRPVRLFAPRPIAAGLREKAKEELDKMLELGVIEPIEKPTTWCSGLTIAPKAGNKIRMCVDLTNLNKGVRREVYPLPKVSDMLSKLSEGVMFSKLDANSGFWQVKLDKKCKELTTFVTPWGRFCFNRMPFGISSAPEYFQRVMEKILHGLEGIICLMDDILVYGKNAVEHWNRLHKVLERIEKSGMTLRKEKCEFGCHEVKFLGHLVSGTGIKPDPNKVEAIVKMLPPTCKKEGRRFTGLVNYLMKFSNKLSSLCKPIYEICGSKSEWYWGPDQQQAFEAVKKEISKSPILCIFDMKAKHRVSADASKDALGAVLLQNNSKSQWQPVEYASRKMTDTETRYAMVEKEALATTWACEKFDYYLVGRKFEIETDHKPLIAILGEKDLSNLPVRVQRFKLRLMRYDYDIFHTPGKDMFLADALSRPNSYNDNCEEKDKEESKMVELYVNSIVSSSMYGDIKEERVRIEVGKDLDSQSCIEHMYSQWPSCIENLSSELIGLHGARERLSIYDGLIMYDSRLYIPKSLRAMYLEACHEGHQGITKCRRRAQRHFWWPGVSKDISDYVTSCTVCIMHTQVKHQPMHESELPCKPWEVLGSDIFSFGGDLYLVIIDYYSKWIEALYVNTQTSKEVIKVMKNVFACFGFPKVIRSDNGACYTSREFRKFAHENGIILATSSPRYPPSNGLAESAVKTIKRLWVKCDDKSLGISAYRTTPLESGYSPSDLMFGRAIRSNLGFPYESDVDYGQFEDSERKRRKKLKQKWDKKYRASNLPELKPGQRVYVKAPTDVGAEGVVLRKDKFPESYWVNVGLSEIRRNRKHLFMLNTEQILDYGNCALKNDVFTGEDNSKLVDVDSDEAFTDAEDITDIAVFEENEPSNRIEEDEMYYSVEEEIVEENSSNTNESNENRLAGDSDVRKSVVTRSGRVSKPPKWNDMVYYN